MTWTSPNAPDHDVRPASGPGESHPRRVPYASAWQTPVEDRVINRPRSWAGSGRFLSTRRGSAADQFHGQEGRPSGSVPRS